METKDVGGGMRAQIDEALDELQRMAGEVRVKIHLGGMEAKDKWKELEPKVHEFESKVNEVTDQAGDDLHALGQDLVERLRKLKKDLT